MDDPPFDNTRYNDINLSTSSSSSSAALLSSVRAERQAREERRKQEHAALRIQKVWRGRKVARDVREKLLLHLEGGVGVEEGGKGLVVLLRGGGDAEYVRRIESVVASWCALASKQNGSMIGFVEPLQRDQDWVTILTILSGKILDLLVRNPTSPNAPSLLSGLETIFDPRSYISLSGDGQASVKGLLVKSMEEKGWVEKLVIVLEKLVATGLPKKKHPSLLPVTRLLTAPFSLVAPTPESPMVPPLINHLLAVPSLPSSLPIPALTHLSTHLNLFTLLLPVAAADPSILMQGKMSSEIGKTYFLANLATFGITGQMLARHGVNGVAVWMGVVGKVLSGVKEGWGRWVDGLMEDDDDDDLRLAAQIDSEDEDDDTMDVDKSVAVPSTRSSRPRRSPLPQSIRSKLTIFATPAHISTLLSNIISPSARAPPSLLVDFAGFAVGLLSAFRGSPRWEGVLDSLGEGEKGRALMKRVWREGVRGKWSNSSDRSAWDTFNDNPLTPCLLLLTHIYCHYLLLTPDDEFFSPSTNAFNTDEILELASIWRDLAFWGYMNGVSGSSHGNAIPSFDAQSSKSAKMGTEEIRGLFTRGVTRVVERNARRQFADPDFWVMKSQIDMQGFVESAVYEDAELSGGNDQDVDMAAQSAQLPRWARARQRFTKRQLAYISPRLGLLNNLPMAVPFQTRLQVFRSFIETDKARLGIDYHGRRLRNHAKIRRNHISEDGFDELGELGPSLKGRVEIIFVDQYGLTEAGIDGGGLFKEFLTSLTKEVFDTNRGLWLATDQNELYPNPHAYATEPHQLNWYRFIGQILGKAIYEGILVDVSFADFFLAKWLGRQSYLDDLNSLDKELYKGLTILKNYSKPEELALNFAITEDNFGVRESVDLVPGGSEIAVTAENRHEYIQLVCKYKLDKQIAAQSRAFFNGLSDLVDAKWLRMFDQQELQQLIGGEETPIDMDDLRAHCDVNGFPNDVTPRLFWKVVKGFSQEERRALLRFVTSCSRPPLLGFAYLNPKFAVKFNGGDVERLPSASACFNLLKLPGYTTESALRTKLLQAITSGAGFDMS